MRRANMVLGGLATLGIAAALLLWLAGPVCACPPALDGARPPSLGRAFRDLDLAQQRLRITSGRYAAAPGDLPPVGLPAEVRVTSLSATDSTYRIQVDSGVTTGRTCVISGGRD